MNGRDAAPLKFDAGRNRSSAETQLTLKFDLEEIVWYGVDGTVLNG